MKHISLIYKPTFQFANINFVQRIVGRFKKEWYWHVRFRLYEDLTYQLLRSLCAVRFVRMRAVLKHNKNVTICSAAQVKNTNITTNKTVLFICWHKSLYRSPVNLLYRTACSYLLFNLMQSIHCFRTVNTEHSNVQPITVPPLSRTATCFGLNRPSVQRSKTI